jgi:hypothetical protein
LRAIGAAGEKLRTEGASDARPALRHCSLLDPEAILVGGGTSDLVVRPRLLHARLRCEAQLYGALWGADQLARKAR